MAVLESLRFILLHTESISSTVMVCVCVCVCVCLFQTGVRAGETFFERVVCFAVSIQSVPLLSCIALWMQVCILYFILHKS